MTNEEYVNRFNESDMPKMAEIWNFFVENHELYLPNNEIDDIESLLKRATVDGVSREDFLLKEEYISPPRRNTAEIIRVRATVQAKCSMFLELIKISNGRRWPPWTMSLIVT